MARIETVKRSLVGVSDIVKIDGFLQEPSGLTPQGTHRA
jgi:hypothetical protein